MPILALESSNGAAIASAEDALEKAAAALALIGGRTSAACAAEKALVCASNTAAAAAAASGQLQAAAVDPGEVAAAAAASAADDGDSCRIPGAYDTQGAAVTVSGAKNSPKQAAVRSLASSKSPEAVTSTRQEAQALRGSIKSSSSGSSSPAVAAQDEAEHLEQEEAPQAQRKEAQQQQQQQKQQQQQQASPPSSHHHVQAVMPEPELVQVPPSILSVKDRVKAINAAGRTSPSGSIATAASVTSVDTETSGSYKPCHSWGRSMGVATSSFSDNAASRAHVSLIDQLQMSQVGTMVERTVVEKRRAPIAGRQDAPLMHIEARHAQAERKAKELVDEALRAHGLRGYKAFEEEEDSP
jgi:hypothetical protein